MTSVIEVGCDANVNGLVFAVINNGVPPYTATISITPAPTFGINQYSSGWTTAVSGNEVIMIASETSFISNGDPSVIAPIGAATETFSYKVEINDAVGTPQQGEYFGFGGTWTVESTCPHRNPRRYGATAPAASSNWAFLGAQGCWRTRRTIRRGGIVF